MAKKSRKAAKKQVLKAVSKARPMTTTIGGVTIRVARTAAKTQKARKIRQAVQNFYG